MKARTYFKIALVVLGFFGMIYGSASFIAFLILIWLLFGELFEVKK